MNPTPAITPLLDNLVNSIGSLSGPSVSGLRNQAVLIRDQVAALESEYATLRNAHTVFKNQTEQTIAQLEESNRDAISKKQEIEAELAKMKAGEAPEPPDLLPDTILLLKRCFDENDEVTEALLVFHFDWVANRVRYHLGALHERGLVQVYNSDRLDGDETSYWITQSGMEFLMRRGLV